MRVKVKDLDPLHSPTVSGDRPALRGLSDTELIEACERPRHGDRIKINSRTGKVVDGNGRAYELLRRARTGGKSITPETEIDCELYSPDVSMFPGLE